MLQGYSAPYKRYKDKQRLRGPQPCNQEGGVAGVGEGEGLWGFERVGRGMGWGRRDKDVSTGNLL